MAKGQVKKAQVKMPAKTETQAGNMIFALDIGTRSVIGMVGVVADDKVKIIAIEKEEHTERAMIDGQFERYSHLYLLFDDRLTDAVRRPAGKYLSACHQGGFEELPRLYKRMLAFAQDNGIHLTGSCYEDLLLDELAVPGDSQYLIQILIPTE